MELIHNCHSGTLIHHLMRWQAKHHCIQETNTIFVYESHHPMKLKTAVATTLFVEQRRSVVST